MEKFKDEQNTLFSVIFGHTLNVILGFIPRIHAKHYSLDTRVKPEYDKDLRLSISILKHLLNVILGFIPRIYTKHSSLDTRVMPEYDKEQSLIKGLDVVRQCAAIFERRVQSSTRVRKAQAVTRQTNPIGRSMIEMLGVLAIIGVLSVGGIQGFSKAMETYQSHKQLEQINSLIYHILELRDTFKQDYRNQSTTRINGLMGAINALGYLPDDMKLISNETAQDRFGNKFILSYGIDTCRQPDGSLSPCNSTSFYLGISLKTINNAFAISSENQCKNIIKAITAFDAENGNISRLELKNNYTTDVIIWGKIYCTDSRQTCFKNMTPIKMTQFCKSCTTENCELILYFIS